MRNQDGSLIIYINGRPVGVAATDLPPRLYGIVDLYGQCAEVKITNVASDSSSTVDPTSANVATPLRFHALCGGNAQISEDRLTASRTHPYEEFTRSTTFTSRPLRPNELFQVTIEVVIDSWSGSLQFGECTCMNILTIELCFLFQLSEVVSKNLFQFQDPFLPSLIPRLSPLSWSRGDSLTNKITPPSLCYILKYRISSIRWPSCYFALHGSVQLLFKVFSLESPPTSVMAGYGTYE